MAAVITLASVAVASDGKTVTATLGGGTAPYAVTNTLGLRVHNTLGQYPVPASASVSGTTLTINLSTPILSGQTAQIDVTAANTLSDSAANTGTAVTNQSATNASTITGAATSVYSNQSLFNFQGAVAMSSSFGFTGASLGAQTITSSTVPGYQVEFVLNVASGTVDVDLEISAQFLVVWQVDGGAVQTYTGLNVTYELLRVATALTAGKHVIRFGQQSALLRSVRLSNGSATFVTVQCPTAIFKDNVANLSVPSQVSPAKRWGNIVYSGSLINNGHGGFQFSVAGNFQGMDLVGAASATSGHVGVAVDNAATPAPYDAYTLATYLSSNQLNNSYQVRPVAAGLTAGTHRVELLDIDVTTLLSVRAWNGSALTGATTVGATTVIVADVTNIAVGDWVCLDHMQNEEIVQVAGISSLTLTLNRALTAAHAVGAAVRNFTPANTPTLTAGVQPTFRGRLMVLGDSISHAEAISPTSQFPATGYATYDVRAAHAFIAARTAGFEFISAATQGWKSADLVSNNYASQDTNKPATVYTVLIGVNDWSQAVALSTYQSNLTTLIGQIKTAAPAGCTILVYKIFGVNLAATNSNGNTRGDFNTTAATVIAATQATGYTIQQVDLAGNLNQASNNVDIPDGVHPSITSGGLAGTGGQNKLATQFLAYLNTINPSAGMFFAA